MEGILAAAFAAVALGLSGAAFWSQVRAHRARGSVWKAAARSANLTDVRLVHPFPPFPMGQSVVGRSDELRVRIESHNNNRSRRQDTRIIVFDDSGRGTGGVTLRPERLAATDLARLFESSEIEIGGVTLRPGRLATKDLARLLESSEIEIGDPTFDDAFFIGGTPALVLAFLDLETRGILLRLSEQGILEIGPMGVRLDFPEEGESRLLTKVQTLLMGLSRRLRDRGHTAERLARNVRDDPQPGVRLGSLLCLIREFGEHPVVADTLRVACEDRSPEVRLRAAVALGARGAEVLLQMTEDLGLADVWQAAAVSALGKRLPIANAAEGLERALRGRRFETARACIEVLGKGDEAGVEPLTTALTVTTGVVAAAAASALGALHEPAAEAPLIRALWRDAPGLRVAAAEALGRSGTAVAVEPLKQAAERHPEAGFRRAARQAIAEIQARLPGASPGQLSLAATEAGQLSLADAEAGRLSLAEGRTGQLSMAEVPTRRAPRDKA